ncbi:MAG: T9SS type A sorting domain-containing protein, partial [Flavobacteriales bacterium]
PYIESYEWTVNGELLSSNNELSFTDISGEMEISLKVSNPICEATQTVVVNPDAQPTLSIENNEFEICPSAEITLIAESTGTISWGDYGTGSELIVQDPNEGVIQVVTTSPGGCTNTSEVSVTYISEDPVFSVENNILTASEAESYQWYQNGDPIDDATNSTFEIIESGSYAVELSYTNGCISISEFQFVGYVGINQQEVSDFLIVPNPAESSFRITGLNAQIVQFYLVNSQGQLVLTGLAQNKQIIQLPAISTGMYFLHLEGYSKPMKLMVR